MMAGFVDLQVTNIDPGIPQSQLRQLVQELFAECGGVSLHSLSTYRQEGGGSVALARLGSQQEAQVAISQLHKRKVGAKRISVLLLDPGPAPLPRNEVVALLKSVPGAEMQLVKFRQLFSASYQVSLSLGDLHRMRDLVTVTEEAETGRLVRLVAQEAEIGKVESPHCSLHLADGPFSSSEELPSVRVSLLQLSERIQLLLVNHGGALPLASVPHCYALQFPPLLAVPGEEGVPLEHLLQAVKGVAITTGVTGIKQLVDCSSGRQEFRNSGLIGPPPALASQLLLFTKELVDLVREAPGCRLHLYKLIPSYHHMFGKQCRVADYGFTKLRDLLDSLPHVVQIIGEGARAVVTIAHKAQVRRFTNDLMKVLKLQQEKRLLLSLFPRAFENCFFKAFDITDYGVCFLLDMLLEVPEGTIVLEPTDGGEAGEEFFMSVFRRDQTMEELNRTRVFAKEVTELLRHSPDFSISFNKFIPSYHQHFGRQCRVSNYGLSKLAELFDCIPETVEVQEVGEERQVQLTMARMVAVVGEQVEAVVARQATRGRASLPLQQLASEYQQKYGHCLPLARLGVAGVREAVALLRDWVRFGESREGEVVTVLDRGLIRTVARNVRKLLVEQGEMGLPDFYRQMATRFACQLPEDMLGTDLSSLVRVRGDRVALSPMQLAAREVEVVLGDGPGLEVAELEEKFLARWGRQLQLDSLGLDSLDQLLAALPEVFTVRGRGARKLVSLVKPAAPPCPAPALSPRPAVAAFSGRGFDMLRLINPPLHAAGGFTQGSAMRPQLPPPKFIPRTSALAPYSSSYYALPSIPLGSPTTPSPASSCTFSYHLPSYTSLPSTSWGSPLSSSPVTFQQHMLRLSPSPLIAPSLPSALLSQPISRPGLDWPLPRQARLAGAD